MAWFKVDDKLHSSRKLMKIPRRHRLAAIGLWTIAGSWAADQLTDGHVPDFMIEEWGGTQNLVKLLCDVELWLPGNFGTDFKNWQEYQPTKAEVEAGREKNAEKLRKWRERNRVTEPDVTELHTGYEPVGNPAPDPTRPDPTPITSNEVIKDVAPRKRGTRIPEPFMVTGEMRAWAAERVPGVDVNSATEKFVNYWRAATTKATKLDWRGTWDNWLITDFERRQPMGKQTKDERASSVLEQGRLIQESRDREAIEQ